MTPGASTHAAWLPPPRVGMLHILSRTSKKTLVGIVRLQFYMAAGVARRDFEVSRLMIEVAVIASGAGMVWRVTYIR